ncbi:hypothetical protein Cyrtocomes_00649 [Candidatus Cyrtobacter comes]|uniref:Uncharacterized protein n=1 Tax=Candidatus Cyrtobacter comes TaxID=675776 RepID=A0ABU5L815_9RICK|nr:hypothetical protein [Candidatus Cyrtobacter comes]
MVCATVMVLLIFYRAKQVAVPLLPSRQLKKLVLIVTS